MANRSVINRYSIVDILSFISEKWYLVFYQMFVYKVLLQDHRLSLVCGYTDNLIPEKYVMHYWNQFLNHTRTIKHLKITVGE